MSFATVVHAEVNAIMHKTCIDLKDCTLYTTLFPCNECVKVIIQAGIKRIHYLTGETEKRRYFIASKGLLKRAGYLNDYDKESQSTTTTRRPKRKREEPEEDNPEKK